MEEILKNTKPSKTKSFESPNLGDKIPVVLDNKTTIYFNKDTPLIKITEKIAKYKSHLNKVSILMGDIQDNYIKDKKSIV